MNATTSSLYLYVYIYLLNARIFYIVAHDTRMQMNSPVEMRILAVNVFLPDSLNKVIVREFIRSCLSTVKSMSCLSINVHVH